MLTTGNLHINTVKASTGIQKCSTSCIQCCGSKFKIILIRIRLKDLLNQSQIRILLKLTSKKNCIFYQKNVGTRNTGCIKFLMSTSVMSSSVRLCGAVSTIVRLCSAVSKSVRLCGAVSTSVRLCGAVSMSVRLCGAVSTTVRLCGAVSTSARLCGAAVSTSARLFDAVSTTVWLCGAESTAVRLCGAVSNSECM